MNVCFETFGCRLNRAEALEMEAAFASRGWKIVSGHAEADLVVVRGCSVTARAQRDSEALVRHIRSKYPTKRVVATGCLEQKLNEHWLRDLKTGGADAVPKRTARAYLKIQDGCSCRCSFCIIPALRGDPASVPFDEVLSRARRFIESGYGEIVVTGCNLSQYSSGGRRLADAVDAIAALDGARHRVRVGSVEPSAAADGLVDAMAGRANICRFLHLSVQSGSNAVLGAMKRPYLVKDVDAIVRKAQSLMPGISVGCDLISGFPGETPNDHLATGTMLKRLNFTNAHVFPYSERPGTPAASMTPRIDPALRSERARSLAAAAAEARAAYARRFKGKRVQIAVEDAERTAGWTGEYLWCAAARESKRPSSGRAAFPSRRKSLVTMTVREVRGDTLFGDPEV